MVKKRMPTLRVAYHELLKRVSSLFPFPSRVVTLCQLLLSHQVIYFLIPVIPWLLTRFLTFL